MMCTRYGKRSQARILVADWDQANALSLAAVVHTAGFKVATACSGKEAVDQAETFRPDLLVTEAYMGRLSGVQAAMLITAARPECKVLFLSSEASFSDIAKSAPDHLVYSYTPKPVHPLDLLNAIAYLLSAEWSTGDPATGPGETQQLRAPETTRAAERIHAGKAQSGLGTKNCFSAAMLQQALL